MTHRNTQTGRAKISSIPDKGRVVTIPVASDCVPTVIEHASVHAYIENEKAAGTRRAYRSDFRIFSTWCASRDRPALLGPVDER